MKEFRSSHILNFDGNPLWGISGLIDNELHLELKKITASKHISDFTDKNPRTEKHKEFSNGIYSVDRDDKNWENMFNCEAIQKIAAKIISPEFLFLTTKLFLKSRSQYKNSKFLLENEISADKNSIQHFAQGKGLLLKPYAHLHKIQENPNIIHDVACWRNTYTKDKFQYKDEVKEYFSTENAIPFFPDMEFNLCHHGSHLTPHTDAERHLATLMINIPLSEEQANSNLGTTYWDRKGMQAYNNFGLGLLSREEVENHMIPNYKRIRTKFNPCQVTLFFRSGTSWHSFEYDMNDIGPRHTIKVHFLCPI